MLVNVDYHIIDKCNLNCVGCNHFCPLVPEDNKPKKIEQIISDLALLSKFKDDLGTLALMGGEPLLHPQLSKILRIARKLFPTNTISLTTNGLLVERVKNIKDAIEEFDIQLVISVYPFNKLNPYSHVEKIKQIIPNVETWEYPTSHGMYINELSPDPNKATKEQVDQCIKRWRCNQLKDGKLYICHYAAQLNYLKDAFKGQVDIPEEESMYLDLNNDSLTIEDIYNFQRTTYPKICFHCSDATAGGYNGECQPWRTSNRKLDEWYK
jgi:organic radical activating enzyme